jgi:hypothetical protein
LSAKIPQHLSGEACAAHARLNDCNDLHVPNLVSPDTVEPAQCLTEERRISAVVLTIVKRSPGIPLQIVENRALKGNVSR